MKSFVGFYNAVEYYFEEAPRVLQRSAPTEMRQLRCVVDLLTIGDDVTRFLNDLEPALRQSVLTDLRTSSGVPIRAFDTLADPQQELARWLYEIRCAVVHSKKTRKGCPTPTFEPYSATSKVLRHVVPVIRWLAVLCIEKDYALRTAT